MWRLADVSSYQYVRSLEKGVYELIEMYLLDSDENESIYKVRKEIINVDYYIKNLEDKLLTILNNFGYKNINDVVSQYGDASKQIMAECIFESDAWTDNDFIYEGSISECSSFIENYIKITNIFWYRADYDNDTESEYFLAKNDSAAIEYAKSLNEVDYADIGTIKRNLIQLFEVDDDTEFFDEIRVVW